MLFPCICKPLDDIIGRHNAQLSGFTQIGNTLLYAEHYIEWKKQGKGKARLKMELVQKGISREIIEEVLESTDFGETREMIRQIILKKRKTDIPMNEKEKQRIYGFLMRKGFSSSDILAVMREEEWRNNTEF